MSEVAHEGSGCLGRRARTPRAYIAWQQFARRTSNVHFQGTHTPCAYSCSSGVRLVYPQYTYTYNIGLMFIVRTYVVEIFFSFFPLFLMSAVVHNTKSRSLKEKWSVTSRSSNSNNK